MRVAISRVVVAHQVGIQQAVRLAQRYGHLATAHVQRIPFEHVVVHDVVAERTIDVGRFEPAAIAQHLAQSVGAVEVAVVYRCTTIGESLAMALAERRLPNT